MMYQEKFVVSLKIGDKFIRDDKGVVKMPFGAEYNIYLKNLNSKKAVVAVSIDGKDVLDGNKIIVEPNSATTLEGWLDGYHTTNRFRFIELTKQIEEHRGYNPEDSIVRVEVWYEKDITPYVITTWGTTYTYPDYSKIVWKDSDIHTWTTDTIPCQHRGRGTSTGVPASANCYSMSNVGDSAPLTNDLGITVKGNEHQQNFSHGYVNNLEENSTVIILKLSGYKDNHKKVDTLLYARDKIVCSTCGTNNKYHNKFCGNCGTYLEK